MESGAYMRALSYALVSVIVSVLALMAALYITRKVLA
jgi:fluoride ion exporter CrcB/FEX